MNRFGIFLDRVLNDLVEFFGIISKFEIDNTILMITCIYIYYIYIILKKRNLNHFYNFCCPLSIYCK